MFASTFSPLYPEENTWSLFSALASIDDSTPPHANGEKRCENVNKRGNEKENLSQSDFDQNLLISLD